MQKAKVVKAHLDDVEFVAKKAIMHELAQITIESRTKFVAYQYFVFIFLIKITLMYALNTFSDSNRYKNFTCIFEIK